MRIIFSFLLILIINQVALSQEYTPVSGKVIDAKTNEPITFATVSLAGHPIGTVTNTDGSFTIYIPAEIRQDSLLVSHLGYTTFRKKISDALTDSPLAINLSEKTILLAEVEINIDQLSAVEIMKKALDQLKINFNSNHFIMKGFFRDVREQNKKTAYLVEASVDVQDPGYSSSKDHKKRFFLKGVRASDSRIHDMLSGSLLNSGNSLIVNLEHNYWLQWLKFNINKQEFKIDDIISKNGKFFYIISTQKSDAKMGLAQDFSEMKYTLTHKYYVDTEAFSIHKVEHLESPIEGKYIAIERPYEGDSLFYSKKGWNQIMEFEDYAGKMYLKYQDVSYTFDIVNRRQQQVYLDMAYQFTFVVTDIEMSRDSKPVGKKMSTKQSLVAQAGQYDHDFWNEVSNAKLSPLTEKQLKDLSEKRGLKAQFESNKKRIK